MNDYMTPNDYYGQPAPPTKHSGVGITSFVLSILSGLLLFLLFIVAGYLETVTPGGMAEDSLATLGIGLALMGFVFLAFVSFVLGIVGLFLPNRKKVFAACGLLLSLITLGGTALLILVGLAMG